MLALGDVEGQALNAYKPPSGVKLTLRDFLEPYLTAIGTYKPITGRSRRGWFDAAPQVLHAPKVVRMDPCKEGGAMKVLVRTIPQDLPSVAAALDQIGERIPLERQNRAYR